MDLDIVVKLIQAAGLHEKKRLREQFLPAALEKMQHLAAEANPLGAVGRFLARFLRGHEGAVQTLLNTYQLAPAIFGGSESLDFFSLLSSRVHPKRRFRWKSRKFPAGRSGFMVALTPNDDAVAHGGVTFQDGVIIVDSQAAQLRSGDKTSYRLYCLCDFPEPTAAFEHEFFLLDWAESVPEEPSDLATLLLQERHLEAAQLMEEEQFSDNERRACLAASYAIQISRARGELEHTPDILGAAKSLQPEVKQSIAEMENAKHALEESMRQELKAQQEENPQ